jgi:hypothetical protein
MRTRWGLVVVRGTIITLQKQELRIVSQTCMQRTIDATLPASAWGRKFFRFQQLLQVGDGVEIVGKLRKDYGSGVVGLMNRKGRR